MDDIIRIRPIKPSDNQSLATIIRAALTEFGADKPGTVYYDKTTDDLYHLFQTPGGRYFVAETGGENNEVPDSDKGFATGRILGGAGIFPSPGLPEGTAELVKMYLAAPARGKGLGKLLIEKCLEFAGSAGYRQVYIETMPELKRAMSVYEKFGFRYLDGPVGDTGHFGCTVWMIRDDLQNSDLRPKT